MGSINIKIFEPTLTVDLPKQIYAEALLALC